MQREYLRPGIHFGQGDGALHNKLFQHPVIMAEQVAGLDEHSLVPDHQLKDIFLVCQPEGRGKVRRITARYLIPRVGIPGKIQPPEISGRQFVLCRQRMACPDEQTALVGKQMQGFPVQSARLFDQSGAGESVVRAMFALVVLNLPMMS